MKVAFATKYPARLERIGGQLTNFKAKLWQGFAHMSLVKLKDTEYVRFLRKLTPREIELIGHVHGKIHSIRTDALNKYVPGALLEFCDLDGKPIAPPMECIGTQKIEIEWLCKTGNCLLDTVVCVDDRQLKHNEIINLAMNDGFDCPEDFFAWYNKNYKGKIVHWTEKKY